MMVGAGQYRRQYEYPERNAKKVKVCELEAKEVLICDLENTIKEQRRAITKEQEKNAQLEEMLAFSNAEVCFNRTRFEEEHKLDMQWVQGLQKLVHSMNRRLSTLTGQQQDLKHIHDREAMARQ